MSFSVSLHLAQSPLGPSVLLQMVRFYPFSRLSNIPPYTRTSSSLSIIHRWTPRWPPFPGYCKQSCSERADHRSLQSRVWVSLGEHPEVGLLGPPSSLVRAFVLKSVLSGMRFFFRFHFHEIPFPSLHTQRVCLQI